MRTLSLEQPLSEFETADSRRWTPMVAEAIRVNRRASAVPYLGGMRSLAIILALLSPALLAVLGFAGAQGKGAQRPWHIKGEFTEACTCNVPCTCNFGEMPSPYEYCHPMWSYWVKEGRFGQTDLNDMHIGGVEGSRGTLGLLDIRATPSQRKAMEEIWHVLSGRRLLCLVRLWPFKASAAGSSGSEPAAQGSTIHTRYGDPRFLGFEYVTIEQDVTERGSRLMFGDRGGFEAWYLFGRDAKKPITVTNIQSWPIDISTKGKTTFFRYKDAFNQLDYKGTNANQGRFDLNHTQSGARPMTGQR